LTPVNWYILNYREYAKLGENLIEKIAKFGEKNNLKIVLNWALPSVQDSEFTLVTYEPFDLLIIF
jgi:hypothetical protein